MSENNGAYFCLTEIAEIKRLFQNTAATLPSLRAQYDKYKGSGLKREQDSLVDLHRSVTRLIGTFPTLMQLLNEYDDTELSDLTVKLFPVLKRYDYLGVTDYRPLCNALLAYADKLPDGDADINTGAIGRLMNRVRMGYFPTDLDHVDILRRAVVFPEQPVNVIDPCCGEGLALARFTAGTKAVTYGVEIDTVRGEEAQERIKRVGFGSFFHSRISLNAFQCLFLNPPYLSAPCEQGSRRLEKSFLADSLRLLANDGLLIYIIPYYRATRDVCRVLCENFTDLRVHRFTGEEFRNFRQVVFLGRKIPRREAYKQTGRLTQYMLDPDNIPAITELPEGAYTLPAAERPVDLFKGAVFNEKELAEQLKRSPSIERLFPQHTGAKRGRQPLLPLNLSQIGLVGASGLMNGLVECDTPHVIKGRIVKEKKSKVGTENEYGKTEIREITSNKLIFNILSPSGFQSLG